MNEIRSVGGMIQEKTKVPEKTRIQITFFSIINPTWNGLGSNPDPLLNKQATNHLTHNTAAAVWCCRNITTLRKNP